MVERMNGPRAEIPRAEARGQPLDDALLRAAPVLARLAAAAWFRAAEWTIETSMRTTIRVVRGAARGETPADLLSEAEAGLRDWARQLLGIVNEQGGNGAAPEASPPATQTPDYVEGEATSLDGHVTEGELRERGAELLRRSADIEYDLDAHPAYARILSELAPDEARILRLLTQQGPRPAVDVRTGGAVGRLKSDLVAPGLTMIAAEAGIRHSDKIHPYLDNLSRLGLIAFSREQLEDLRLYQVLEAQPDVAEAMEKAGRGKTVRRSIELTTFGQDFCKCCLPVDTAEIEALTMPEPAGP
ncbi:MAG TPA: Abi-alpha family protein [Thermoleophilaceae bacterium]|nr:Abi-alpha family protein [Thermoleophilaceae bacterium]